MSGSSNLKAYCLGAAVVATVPSIAATYIAIRSESPWPIAIIGYGSIVLSGFITGWFSDSRNVLLAMLLALPLTVSMVIASTVHHLLGFPTYPLGFYGAMDIATVFLPLGVLLCGIGGVLGWWVARSKHNNRLQRTAGE
jgi:hypothetical protein